MRDVDYGQFSETTSSSTLIRLALFIQEKLSSYFLNMNRSDVWGLECSRIGIIPIADTLLDTFPNEALLSSLLLASASASTFILLQILVIFIMFHEVV